MSFFDVKNKEAEAYADQCNDCWSNDYEGFDAGQRSRDQEVADLKEVIADKERIAREMDVFINGEAGAAKQPALIDVFASVRDLVKERDELREIARSSLPDDCIKGYGEVKFCSHRNGEGNRCKHCI